MNNKNIILFNLNNYDYLINSDIASYWDICHIVAALQGIVNRDAPRLYLKYIHNEMLNKNVDKYWLQKITSENTWLAGAEITEINDVFELIEKFKLQINGVVVYDSEVPATSNLASTIAGVENLLPIRYNNDKESLYTKLLVEQQKLSVVKRLINEDGSPKFTGEGKIPDTEINSTGSAKCDAYLWMKHFYIDTGLCNNKWAAYYSDFYWVKCWEKAPANHHCLTNHDFFISNKAFFFDLSPWGDETPIDDQNQPVGSDLETLKSLLLGAYQNRNEKEMLHIGGFVPWAYKYTTESDGKHDPVSSEWEYGKIISAYNGFMDADALDYGAMANASFYRHFPLESEYSQRWAEKTDVENLLVNIQSHNSETQRQYIIFYVGDYDCAAWLYQRIPDIWDDPNRGIIPMMWAISPVIAERAPMAMDYIRKTATPNDYFVAADNGAGYCEPGMLQPPREISNLPSGLPAWENHCAAYYKKWGLSVTGFIIPGNGPNLNKEGLDTYSRFSPDGIVQLVGEEPFLHNDMPVLTAARDIQFYNPLEAARVTVDNIRERKKQGQPPFHWYRNILKSPTWYIELYEEIKRIDSNIELLAAPEFFELLRQYLNNKKM